MRTNRILALIGVVAALLVVAGAGALAATDGPSNSTDNQTISVTGSGEIDAQPDAAEVRLSVRATADSAGSVSSQLASDAERLRSSLTEFGIASENIRTERYYVREDPRTRERPNETRYAGEHSFEVTVEDVDQVGALIDVATDGGADDVNGVSYTLSEDRRETIRNDAIRSAIDNARSDASVIADATDLTVTGVSAASTQQSSVVPYRAAFEAADGGDGGTTIEPRDVTVTATVHVTFSATDAT